MDYLLDTNILLRFIFRTDPRYPIVKTAIRKLRNDKHTLYISSQNCIEFWNVATRPTAKNGFGLTPTDAKRMLQRIERLFPLLPETPAVYHEWRRLVVTYNVSGVQVHDAHLVAAMKAQNLSHILTFNINDFRRYAAEGIVVVDSGTV
ncbi:type II toxin-antitoxin system VapC family toxin [Anabaena azotica]|uniref:Type II toxin-antitoxin system VapC family toxin n=1 Tax=Anabaena azotica FACHB-119 TaxID=947527 RepID=A0ABR8D5J0_9NOST|nr:PIN domain-containing protein [Anabaena azotica]MBD2502428.1 type II toxin-antitoxin system VapC family toxin [Anabaena azotica FACHB-119]